MKPFCTLLATFSLFLLSSCKKYIQQQEQTQAIAIMTDGQWYVSHYEQNDSDITASLSNYLFKFNADNTVTATSAPSDTVQGQWLDNLTNLTITADFRNAGMPLDLLNETWKITDSYTDSVAAKCPDPVNHTTNIL